MNTWFPPKLWTTLAVLVSTGCGGLSLSRADMKIRTRTSPTVPPPFADAQAAKPAPAPPSPSPSAPVAPASPPTPSPAPALPHPATPPVVPSSPSPPVFTPPSPPAPPPAPAPTPPVVAASLSAATGPQVGSNAVTTVFGSNPTFIRVEIRRLAGNTAPNCTSGTVAKVYDLPFTANATFYDQTNQAGSVFSYRACFIDSSNGVTPGNDEPSATTKPQLLFVTAATLTGAMGGSAAAADSLCGPFAAASPQLPLTTEPTWQAVLSDSNVNASARIQIQGAVVAADFSETQPFHTLFTGSTQMWGSGLSSTSGSILDANGNPSTSPVWTGSSSSGHYVASSACANWTFATSSDVGETGDASTTQGSGWLNGAGTTTCDQQQALYCIAEPTPIVAAVTGMTQPNSVDLTITPPPQWTASGSIVIRRRASASGLPSTTCASVLDTPVDTVTPLTGNIVHFTDTQVVASTPYNYAACLFDENSSLVYSTMVLHIVSSP